MKFYLKTLSLVIAAGCLFIAGVSFGNYKTSKRLDEYFSHVLLPYTSSIELKSRILILESLKSGKVEKAQNHLERLVDNDLAELALCLEMSPLRQNKDVIEAIRIAKKYREKYPEHQVSPVLKNSVKKTLDFVNSDLSEN